MKILFPVHVFFPDHFYGTETYTLELAKALKIFGHETVILTTTPYGEKGAGRIHSTYEYDGLPVHCIDLNLKPHNRFRQTYYRPDLYPILQNIISEIGPDIVHVTHLINHTSTLLKVLREAQIPTVATLTDFFGICFNNKLERYDGSLCLGPNKKSTNCLCCYLRESKEVYSEKFLAPFLRNNILISLVSRFLPYLTKLPGLRKGSLSDHVLDVTCRINTLRDLYGIYQYMIAPTDFLYEAYVANHFYPDRLRKINFGINLDLVKDYQKPRKKTNSMIRFGYIGQLSSHKGVDLLIRSYLGLRGDNKSLVLYGPFDQDRPYMDELLRLSSGDGHIEFKSTFPREELAARLSKLDVLVIPSRWYENSPLVLLYALATRTPVIVTDVKGMSEFVKDGFNGHTFQKNSVDDLTSVMQKIVDDPVCIKRLSENAIYSKDVSDYAGEILEIYEAVLAGQGDVVQDQ